MNETTTTTTITTTSAWPILVIATLGSFIAPFTGTSMNVALPAIGIHFQMSASLLAWTATTYLLSTAIFLIPMGRLADIYGKRIFYLGGMSLYLLVSVISIHAPNYQIFILLRFFQGIAAAMIFSTGMAILISHYPRHQRGRILGINSVAVYLGLFFGPLLGGIATERWGWNGIFWLISLFVLPLPLLVFLHIPRDKPLAQGEKFAIHGPLLYAAGITGLIMGFSNITKPWGMLLTVSSLFILFYFISSQQKQMHPLIPVNLFRDNLKLSLAGLSAFIHYSATFAVQFLLGLYLQHVKGASPEVVGKVLMVQPVFMIIFSPLAGLLSDKINTAIIAAVGMFVSMIGIGALALLNDQSSFYYIGGALAILGVGIGLFSAPNTNAILGSAEKRYHGIISSVIGTMRLTGQMLSMGVATTFLSIFLGSSQITAQRYPLLIKSSNYTLAFFTILCAVGVVTSIKRR
ncbi:MAG: MFS transporter [Oligoflexia bacterium]|nr:MFS transporter [Oligoflexia bacterium]